MAVSGAQRRTAQPRALPCAWYPGRAAWSCGAARSALLHEVTASSRTKRRCLLWEKQLLLGGECPGTGPLPALRWAESTGFLLSSVAGTLRVPAAPQSHTRQPAAAHGPAASLGLLRRGTGRSCSFFPSFAPAKQTQEGKLWKSSAGIMPVLRGAEPPPCGTAASGIGPALQAVEQMWGAVDFVPQGASCSRAWLWLCPPSPRVAALAPKTSLGSGRGTSLVQLLSYVMCS